MIFHAIGLMSGTSLDGLDICYSVFTQDIAGKWNFEILHAETVAYNENWHRKLRDSVTLPATELFELHSDFGFYLAEEVQKFIRKNSIEKLDVIGSHGHTVHHQPKKKYTVQIGDGRAIMLLTKIPTVYDFRSQDVLMNGNGAPLVPIGDRLLFSAYDACLNLGGFSNISFEHNQQRIAFDISPVNTVFNYFAEQKHQLYDDEGKIARTGKTDLKILNELNALLYYSQTPPKSLGIEWVYQEVFPLLTNLTPEDAMATFSEHAAFQISKIFNQFNLKNVLVTGGGAYNTFFTEKMQQKTVTKLIIADRQITDFKEALIFAFMAVLKLVGSNNVLSSATGSDRDHSTGILLNCS